MHVDYNRSVDELLLDIHDPTHGGITEITPRFATLLVRLSREAAESANKMMRVTRQLLWITWGCFFLMLHCLRPT